MKKIKEPKSMKCPNCKKPMKKQYDHIQKRKSGYLWRCENCMPKGVNLAVA